MQEMFGKYAEYIVPAYAITALVLGYLVISSLAHARRWKRIYEERAKK